MAETPVLEMPVPWGDHQGQQQQWDGSQLSLKDKLCILHSVEREKQPKPFGGIQKIVSGFQILET